MVIAERWLADTLSTYPERSSAVFARASDRFANPVGHALRTGTSAALAALVDEKAPAEVAACLDEVIRIRAVQEFKPSEAISFVLLLKDAVRAELGGEWTELDRRIDQVALAAFDVYVRYKAQVYELRANEVRRSVAGLLDRMNRRDRRVAGAGGTDAPDGTSSADSLRSAAGHPAATEVAQLVASGSQSERGEGR